LTGVWPAFGLHLAKHLACNLAYQCRHLANIWAAFGELMKYLRKCLADEMPEKMPG
jgi:hypothetical protein